MYPLFLLRKVPFAQRYFTDTTTDGSGASLCAGMAIVNGATFYMLSLFPGCNPNLNVRLLVSERRNQQVVNQWVRDRADKYYFLEDLKQWGAHYSYWINPRHIAMDHQPVYNAYLLLLHTNGDSPLYDEFDSGLADVAFLGRSVLKLKNEIWLAAS